MVRIVTRRWETLGQVGDDTPGLGQIDHDCVAPLGIVLWPGDGESLSKNVTVANGHNITQTVILGKKIERFVLNVSKSGLHGYSRNGVFLLFINYSIIC